ncbi:FlhC family transcriptional regulator [Halotalea alkalilenta]|uniref:FlhC family transcriptional regulator n=1 Tax=Halotalea alkalilenta TaxID=376489 RepID=UPI000694C664|nr:FlhC family transcriptional regulator [Halotalea alkalilenta]
MAGHGLIEQMHQQQLAIEMIELGARTSVIMQSVAISYGRLARIHREKTGTHLPKGALPFAADWFLQWRPNMHASLFYNIHRQFELRTSAAPAERLLKSYRLYLQWQEDAWENALLSLTRAWTMLRFLDGDLLQTTRCTRCEILFIDHANAPRCGYVCGLCQPPARAGSGREAGSAQSRWRPTVQGLATDGMGANEDRQEAATSVEHARRSNRFVQGTQRLNRLC